MVHSTGDSDDKLHKEFKKLGFTVTYTVMEYFSELDYKNEENIPLEYQINDIHERIKIYEPYDDSIYQKFIDESLIILNKYKKECETFNHIIFFQRIVFFLTQKCMVDINALSESGLKLVFLLIVMKDIYLIKEIKNVKKLNVKMIKMMIIKAIKIGEFSF